MWPAVAAVLVLALAGGAFFARDLWGVVFPPDFDGPGSGHVVNRDDHDGFMRALDGWI